MPKLVYLVEGGADDRPRAARRRPTSAEPINGSDFSSLSSSSALTLQQLLGDGDTEDEASFTAFIYCPVDWPSVRSRLSSHPDEAVVYNDLGESPLLRSLRKRNPPIPAEAVRAFLEANEAAAFETNDFGATPLHLACSEGLSVSAIRLLVEANPSAATEKDWLGSIPLHSAETEGVARLLLETHPEGCAVQDDGLNLPLHVACDNLGHQTPGLVRLLLDEGRKQGLGNGKGSVVGAKGKGDGGVSVRNRNGDTPLDLACAAVLRRKRLDREGRPVIDGGWDASLWEKLELLAGAASDALIPAGELNRQASSAQLGNNGVLEQHTLREDGRQDRSHKRGRRGGPHSTAKDAASEGWASLQWPRPPYPIHSLVRLNCPPKIIYLAVLLYPHHLSLHDDSGLTPLGVALRHNHSLGPESPPCVATVATLIHLKASAEGRLPLHIAAEEGVRMDEGSKSVLRLAPWQLEASERDSGLLPFMTAAAAAAASTADAGGDAKGEGRLRGLDATLQLLREGPHVLGFFVDGSGSVQSRWGKRKREDSALGA